MTRSYLCYFNIVLSVVVYIILELRIRSLHGNLTPNESIPMEKRTATNRSPLVLYNRIPKTGSTTLTNAVAYDLCTENGFHAIHLNMTKNRYMMNMADQSRFVQNVSEWTERLPAFYHGHVAYVDFAKFGYVNPIYINMVRDPLERLLSHYYFLRYGDNFRIGLKRSKAGNNETFDECWNRHAKDCDPKQLWLQIPYFCGTASFCSEIGSERALEQAKWNVANKYLAVGLTERMEDFVAILEKLVPSFFKGALGHFQSLDESRSHLRSTKKKIKPSEETIRSVQSEKVYQMERDFYDFVAAEFESVYKRTHDEEDKKFLSQQFHYEKLRP